MNPYQCLNCKQFNREYMIEPFCTPNCKKRFELRAILQKESQLTNSIIKKNQSQKKDKISNLKDELIRRQNKIDSLEATISKIKSQFFIDGKAPGIKLSIDVKNDKLCKKRMRKRIFQLEQMVAKKTMSEVFLDSREWKELRYKAITKYGRKCMACGVTDGIIQVDHIKPRFKHPELALDLNNLQILCKQCNHGKSYLDETDWRPKEQSYGS